MTLFHLYIDDSGTRRPDRKVNPPRADGVDHFALGGILINEEDISKLLDAHSSLLERWGLDVPLHSTRIRGRRGNFAWLGENEQTEAKFFGRFGANAACVARAGYRLCD